MSDQKLTADQLESIKELAASLKASGMAYDEFGNELTEEQKADKRRIAREEATRRKLEQEFNEAADRMKNFGMKFLNFAKKLSNADTAFQGMADLIGDGLIKLGDFAKYSKYAGAVMKAGLDVSGQTVKWLASETLTAYKQFQTLSSSGTIASYQGMLDALDKTNLQFADLTDILSKNSENLALLGGSAIDGSKYLQSVLQHTSGYAEQVMKAGMSQKEFGETVANYVNFQNRSGVLFGKGFEEVAEGAKNYAEQIIATAKLTGMSRTDIQKRIADYQRDARYRAARAELINQGQTDQANRMERALGLFGNEEVTAGIMEALEANAEIGPKAQILAQALNQGGASLINLTQQYKKGLISEGEFRDSVNRALAASADKLRKSAAVFGNEDSIRALFIAGQDAIALTTKKTDEITATQNKNRAEQIKTGDAFAEAMTSAYNLSVSLQYLAANTKLLTGTMAYLSGAMEWFIRWMQTGSAPSAPISSSEVNPSGNFKPGSFNPKPLPSPTKAPETPSTSVTPVPKATGVPKLASGAIVPPTAGGTLVTVGEGGKAEAVVPLPNGRSIPVELKSDSNYSQDLSSIVDSLGNKMDTIIDLLHQGTNYNKNIAYNVAY